MNRLSNNFSFLISIVMLVFLLSETSAIASLERANSESADLFYSGVEHLQYERYQPASLDFTRVIDLQQEFIPQAYSNRCLAYLQLQNYPAAIEDCQRAISLNPENTEAYLNLGLAYYRQQDYRAAIEPYRHIIGQNSADWRAYYNLGLVYQALENYHDAIANYNLALKINSDAPQQQGQIYRDRGLSYLLSQSLELAIADFTQSIDLDKQNELAYYNRACAYHQQQNWVAAIADFTQVIKLNPTMAQVYVNRGWLYHQIGRNRLAIADLRLACQKFKQQGNMTAYRQTIALINKLQSSVAIG
jgi:tetratricopeptide (TPR) repeat protein